MDCPATIPARVTTTGAGARAGRGGGAWRRRARSYARAEGDGASRAEARAGAAGATAKRATATHAVVSNRPAERERPHTRAPTGATAAAAAAAAAAAVAAATSRALLSPRNAKTRCGSTGRSRGEAAARFFACVGHAHVHGGELRRRLQVGKLNRSARGRRTKHAARLTTTRGSPI